MRTCIGVSTITHSTHVRNINGNPRAVSVITLATVPPIFGVKIATGCNMKSMLVMFLSCGRESHARARGFFFLVVFLFSLATTLSCTSYPLW